MGGVGEVQAWLIVSFVVHLIVLGAGEVYLYKTRQVLTRWWARRVCGAVPARRADPRRPFWEMRLATFQVLREDSSPRPAVLFAGDSLTNAFEWAECVSRDGAPLVVNRGITGVGVDFLVEHFEEIFVPGYAVHQVFLMIGVNDVRAPTFIMDRFMAAYDTLLAQLLTHFAPDAIYLQSLLPMRLDGVPPAVIPAVNARIRALAESKGVTFIDLFPALADAQGRLADKCSLGGVHISAEGYRRWVEGLRPHLERVAGA
jgi:lysophospholipase L1-like esterase